MSQNSLDFTKHERIYRLCQLVRIWYLLHRGTSQWQQSDNCQVMREASAPIKAQNSLCLLPLLLFVEFFLKIECNKFQHLFVVCSENLHQCSWFKALTWMLNAYRMISFRSLFIHGSGPLFTCYVALKLDMYISVTVRWGMSRGILYIKDNRSKNIS